MGDSKDKTFENNNVKQDGLGIIHRTFDSSDTPIFIVMDGFIVYVNESLAKISGYSRDELIGLSISAIIVPEMLAEIFERNIRRQNGEDEVNNYEILAIRKDGTVMKLNSYFTSIMLDDNPASLVFVLNSSKSHTAEMKQKQANDKLRLNVERLRLFSNCISNLSINYDNNINKLTELCGKIFNADYVFYNRIEGELIYSMGQWNAPENMKRWNRREDFVCNYLFLQSINDFLYIPEIDKSEYFDIYPFIKDMGLKTYVSHIVKYVNTKFGALCLLFKSDYKPSEEDYNLLELISLEIANEELRRRKEIAINKSKENYINLYNTIRLMTDTVPYMLWAKDIEGKFTFVNKSMSKTFFNTTNLEEPIGKTLEYFLEKENKSHPDNKIWNTIGKNDANTDEIIKESLKSIHYEESGYLRGEYIILDILKSPIINNENTVTGIIGCAEIISESKANISKNNIERYSEIFEQLYFGLAISDNSGKILEWNKNMVSITEYSREEVLGKYIGDVIKWLIPEDVHSDNLGFSAINMFEEIFKSNNNLPINKSAVKRISTKSGKVKIIRNIRNKISTNGKSIIFFINEDITEKVHKEQQLKKIENELRESITAKDKFFSIIAHDLKNPFQGIIGYSNLLCESMEDFNDEEKRQMIENIKNLSVQTHKLLENLLIWSNLQTGTINFEPERINLSDIINEIIELLSLSSKIKNIQIISDIPTFCNAYCDKNMLTTIFRNLISNAIKFSNYGDVIRVYCKNESENTICIAVEDSGLGMDEETLNGIFKLNKSVRKKGTAGETGSGLGLILCKEFVEKNNGKIFIESQKGKGTKVFVELPKFK